MAMAKPCDPSVRANIKTMAAAGVLRKHIAFELGVSKNTVDSHAASRGRMGYQTRIRLPSAAGDRLKREAAAAGMCAASYARRILLDALRDPASPHRPIAHAPAGNADARGI